MLKRISASDVISILIVAFVGCANLIYPFTGDQAFFAVAARQLNHGAVLYKDIWDLKQPGIFWFYQLAERLFGSTEVGIHAFEILYFIAFAIVIVITLKRHVRVSVSTGLAVLLTIGLYFIVSGAWHLTQVEGLVSFPLFLCLYFSLPSIKPARFFCLGLVTAVVALFKLILIILPGCFVLLTIISLLYQRRVSVSEMLRKIILPALAGWVVLLIPVVGYFGFHHQLGLMARTYFIYPPQIISTLHGSGLAVLKDSMRWFTLAALPLVPFAIWGAYARLRRGWDAFIAGLVCWIILAVVVFFMQRMWWEYHTLLILFPLGFLAAMGLDELMGAAIDARDQTARRGPSLLVMAGLAILFLPLAVRFGRKVAHETRDGLPLSQIKQIEFRGMIEPAYTQATSEAQPLTESTALPGGVYVLGNPLIYYVSNRDQAIAINGWSPEWLLPEQWRELAAQLDSRRPVYVFVDFNDWQILNQRGEAFTQVLQKDYLPWNSDWGGTWYRLRK